MLPYCELHCKTNFSFLRGASHADELVARAVELEYHALAVTDLNSLAGIVKAHAAAKASGLKLLVGAEITPVDAPAVVLWVTDRPAYGRLCRLLTVGRRRAPKGACAICFADIAQYADGLIAGLIPGDNFDPRNCILIEICLAPTLISWPNSCWDLTTITGRRKSDSCRVTQACPSRLPEMSTTMSLRAS